MEQVKFIYIKSIRKSRFGERFHHPYRSSLRKYRKIIRKNKINQIVINRSVLRKLQDSGEMEELLKAAELVTGDNLAQRFVSQLLEGSYKHFGISKKDLRPVVLDREELEEQVPEVLMKIYEDLNYLAVVTKRPDYFEEFSDELYEETGLLMRMTNGIPKEANLLIDLKLLYREECQFELEGHTIDGGLLQALLIGISEVRMHEFDIACKSSFKHFPKRIGDYRHLS